MLALRSPAEGAWGEDLQRDYPLGSQVGGAVYAPDTALAAHAGLDPVARELLTQIQERRIQLCGTRPHPSSLNGFEGGCGFGLGWGWGEGAGAGVGATGAGEGVTGAGLGVEGAGRGMGAGAGEAGAGVGLERGRARRSGGSAAAGPRPRTTGSARVPTGSGAAPGIAVLRDPGSSRLACATAYEIEKAATSSAPNRSRRREKMRIGLHHSLGSLCGKGTNAHVEPVLAPTRGNPDRS